MNTKKDVQQLDLETLRKDLLASCPLLIARDQVEAITGGMINKRTLANLDSKKMGPRGKVRMGQIKVGYMRGPFVEWFVNRLALVQHEGDA